MSKSNGIKRRDFIKYSAIGAAAVSTLGCNSLSGRKNMAKVALIKTDNRKKGVSEVLKLLDFKSAKNKNVFIKPNFNTADPAPGSTHNDTLTQLIYELRESGAKGITVGDRSGPQPTEEVLKNKGILDLAEDLKFKVINFAELPDEDWLHYNPEGNHWQNGFYIARPIIESEYTVSTHCLKTHQYGGVFTMALKLNVGIAPRKLMRELHSSPDQRKMIAELNMCHEQKLLVLDGIEAFVDGGPMEGELKRADVFLAGTDPVAMDAVGVAILKELGSNEAIMDTKIFEQEQIARAAELGLGVTGPEAIEIKTADKAGADYAEKIRGILMEG